MAFKLTIIGAGSLTFARTLFTDIMHVPALRGIEVAFTDISQQNLDMVTQLCQRDLEANNIPTKIFATTNRREALNGRALHRQLRAHRRLGSLRE
jgi:Alpha-galactosidases/6-phospho-beta-glucosidases, family 4 of glycosyl hydrolases